MCRGMGGRGGEGQVGGKEGGRKVFVWDGEKQVGGTGQVCGHGRLEVEGESVWGLGGEEQEVWRCAACSSSN